MPKIQSIKNVDIDFSDAKSWFNENMAVDKIDLNDQKVYENVYHDGRWADIFQCTSSGAQKLFQKAKPRSIIDIAALTSIYRPGPLASHVDKLWLKHEVEPYDWGHPLINETLKSSRGLLIFQEDVMRLANKVGGFPMEKCDEVRRAIMKRSISGGEAAKKAAADLEASFVAGAVEKGVPEDIAKKAYQTILFMSGYGFNLSHACGYAVVSYWCAWLLTHHTDEWLTSYLEMNSSNPEDKAQASGVVKSLGYKIIPVDINLAERGWRALPNKQFMPSFLSIKGLGASALEELCENRPYTSIENFLWNEEGDWRHSKFNRKALDALIKVGGFDSLNCVGEGKLFKTYRHMYEVIINNMAEIKKTPCKDPGYGRRRFYELAKEVENLPDWTMQEKAMNQVEVLGGVDVNMLVPPDILQHLKSKGIPSIEEHDGSTGLHWFLATEQVLKPTKKGTKYLRIAAAGLSGRCTWLNVWGWKGEKLIEPYALCIAGIEKNDMGFSCKAWELKIIGGK